MEGRKVGGLYFVTADGDYTPDMGEWQQKRRDKKVEI